MNRQVRHLLTLSDFAAEEIAWLVKRAQQLKHEKIQSRHRETLKGRQAALLFEMPSTRTRVAFEAGMAQLGGTALFINPNDSQLGRGEPIVDTARVLSEYVDIVVIRTAKQETIEQFAQAATIPVINGMSSVWHPCQILADLQTFEENRGSIQDCRVSFIGDGYNMCNSYMQASSLMNFHLTVCCPATHQPEPKIKQMFPKVKYVANPHEAVKSADLIVTDVWASMGHENDAGRLCAFNGFQITEELVDCADPNVLLFHCLPAHRGEEVNHTVLDDPRSVVFEEAGNRLHTQKALLEFLLGTVEPTSA